VVNGNWHHLVATYDGVTLAIYLNGGLKSRGVEAIDTAASDLLIGVGVEGTTFFRGILDEVRLYNRALSQAEVIALFTEKLPLDTDKDGLSDEEENIKYFTNPLWADSDGDGLSDRDEVLVYRTNPNNIDTDSDNYSDFAEVAADKNPLDPKSNPAGLINAYTALEIEFYPQKGKNYQVQTSPDLKSWSVLDRVISPSNPVFRKLYSIRGTTHLFYRVEPVP
jgi:hypothetical protein